MKDGWMMVTGKTRRVSTFNVLCAHQLPNFFSGLEGKIVAQFILLEALESGPPQHHHQKA